MQAVHAAIAAGEYVYAGHALKRLAERKVSQPEVQQVLVSGYHEKAKDAFDGHFQSWNYAIRGKTVDSRELRVVVTFDATMLVVTVVDPKD
ncbi:MAG TPA: DUF4258 domain-containing protein [bacterium]|nr:DUF4258 domain-containing protein [bacterium]